MSRWKMILVAWALCTLLAAPLVALSGGRLAPAATTEPPELERALIRKAPEIIRYLKEKGYHNVGVLKFLAVKSDSAASDNVGTLNTILAQRLEVALVLANDPRHPLGIVSGASGVAQRTPGANHLTELGRRKLFEPRYPLAWGRQTVAVDVFVTGVARVADDLRTMTISLLCFDRQENKVGPILPDFEAANRPDHLGEMGESFVLRGKFDDDETNPAVRQRAKQARALNSAHKVKEGAAAHPAADRAAPARLEVYYDDRLIELEQRGGKAFVAEPHQGQKVVFVVKRDGTKNRYGVVLKVNGVNTLEKQRLPDVACRRWVLEPGDGPLTVTGYQIDRVSREVFRVLSAPESKAREMNYGSDVGTVTMTVFKERQGRLAQPDLSDEAAETTAVARAQLPDRTPANFRALKSYLLEEVNRGLIAEGERVAGKIRRVRFDADPTPVMTLTVVYYRKGA